MQIPEGRYLDPLDGRLDAEHSDVASVARPGDELSSTGHQRRRRASRYGAVIRGDVTQGVRVDLVAYLDESRKPVRDPRTGRVSGNREHYVIAAAVVLHAEQDGTRESVRAIERDLGFALHYGELRSRARKVAVVNALVALPDWDGYLFETASPIDFRRRSEHAVRAAIRAEAFPALEKGAGVASITLESRAMVPDPVGTIDSKDLDVLRHLRKTGRVSGALDIGHAPKDEAILAIADVLAGARGDFVCGADRGVYPRLAHRIRGDVWRVAV